MKSSGKSHAPVTAFERQTGHRPLYIAWLVLDEARDYFRAEISENYAAEFARRAERVFAGNPFWRRKFKSAAGREYLLACMRHWLAGVLDREHPALFRDLPDSCKFGKPLPSSGLRPAEPRPGISPVRRAKEPPEKPRGSGRESAQPSRRSRFTSAATVSRAGSRGRSPHHPVLHFVHGSELLAA